MAAQALGHSQSLNSNSESLTLPQIPNFDSSLWTFALPKLPRLDPDSLEVSRSPVSVPVSAPVSSTELVLLSFFAREWGFVSSAPIGRI